MDYQVVIEKAEDGSFSGYLPDLPGCVACGDTAEGVESLIREAVSLHFESLRDRGEPIPNPTARATVVHAAGAVQTPGFTQQAVHLIMPGTAVVARDTRRPSLLAVCADHVEKVCGPCCEKVGEAFANLEQIMNKLDGNYLGIASAEPGRMEPFWTVGRPDPDGPPDPVAPELAQAYQTSNDRLEEAHGRAHESGRRYIDYCLARITFSRNYMTAIHRIQQAACAAREADAADMDGERLRPDADSPCVIMPQPSDGRSVSNRIDSSGPATAAPPTSRCSRPHRMRF